MKRFAILAGAAVFVVGNVAAQATGPETGPVMLPVADTEDLLTSPFLLNLPAGINLISSPLDTGSVPVRDAFKGMGSKWPYLYEWDISSQQFIAAGDAPLTPSAGYWYYTPAPNTLVIRGEPYHPLSDLTKDIVPGWHLLGVPFLEGIPWRNVQLYAAGNPVGLETAKELGWIGPDILTMQGSEWQEHVVGQPFEPGSAYWFETTVPLSLRATGLAQAAALPELPQGAVTVTVKFLDKVVKGVVDMVKVGEDVSAGKLATGAFKGAGVVFGIANAAIGRYRYDNIMDDLDEMDAKLDELLVDVAAIQDQLDSVADAIDGLTNYIYNTSRLGAPQSNAESWLTNYYDNTSKSQQSYNWGRWSMAGCDLSQSTCDNEVTDASTDAFNGKNVLHPENDPPLHVSDNFYLWWAYSVLGNQAAYVPPYQAGGDTADILVTKIYQGLIKDAGTPQNALYAYMKWVFDNSVCKNDVSDDLCDLYTEVYEPVEAYFQQLIADQVNLVQAIVDAKSVLASTDENQTTHTYDTAISDYLTAHDGFVYQLADEAEIFLQVAEQIALYRAADGRFDWSTFGTSDAGQLLARADFVAAQLASPSGSGEPWPWPPGVTGRIFYTQQQALPSATQHQACLGATCTPLTEVTPEDSLLGDWPYLQFTVVDQVGQGTPTQEWKVRRLIPQPLGAGTYQVASVNSKLGYGNANLVVAEYGSDYSNPPTDPTDAVLFGSFNGLEGLWGPGNWSISGGSDDALHDFNLPSPTYASTAVSVTYKTDKSQKEGNWYRKDYFLLKSLPATQNRVRIRWPATISIAVSSSYAGCCAEHYYQKLAQSLKVLEPDNDVVPGTDNLWNLCGKDFAKCNISYQDRNGEMMLETLPMTLTLNSKYTLQAHFNDLIWGAYGTVPCTCSLYPSSGSKATWTLFTPTFTLTK